MKVLLLKDVYKLGRAGDVKRVADGYGRNFLLPQRLAVLATDDALKMAEQIKTAASARRAALNQEMGGVASQIEKLVLTFPARASETGKLFGSITIASIADAINAKTGLEINRRQVDTQPIRTLGTFTVNVRLTVDLIPSLKVIVHREGEQPVLASTEAETEAEAEVEAEEAAVEASAETEAESAA